MNGESKSIFTSVTFWGLVIGIVSQVAMRYGYVVPGDTAGLANDLSGAAGAVLVLWGRIRATQPVRVFGPPSEGEKR